MDGLERTRLLRRLALQFGDAIPIVEGGHFMPCAVCGQFFDKRDFAEVDYHDEHPHKPMMADA
jgi:hypothetical protein